MIYQFIKNYLLSDCTPWNFRICQLIIIRSSELKLVVLITWHLLNYVLKLKDCYNFNCGFMRLRKNVIGNLLFYRLFLLIDNIACSTLGNPGMNLIILFT